MDNDNRTNLKKIRGLVVNHGYVQIRFCHKGQWHYKNFGQDTPANRRVALCYLKDMRLKLKTGTVSLNDRRLSFNKAVELYLELKQPAKTSVEYYALNGTFKDAFEGCALADITPVRVKEWRTKRLTEGVQENTVNREQAVLSAFFNTLTRAVKTGDIEAYELPAENPCQFVQKTNEALYRRHRVLTLQELQTLKLKCNELNYTDLWGHIKLAIVTTLRRKDLLKEVNQHVKGSVEKETKALRGLQAKTGRLYSIPVSNQSAGEILGSSVKPLTQQQIRTQWARVREEAGIKDAQWRDLRRTGATLLGEAGYSTQLIKGVLGHASESMTEDYLDLRTKAITPLVKHLEGLLSAL